eukprot:183337_1
MAANTNLCLSYIIALLLKCYLSQPNNTYVYVSKNGINNENCGAYIEPCGTFYYASTLLDLFTNKSTIYVIDGQNETEIQIYIDDVIINSNISNTTNNHTYYYHPCLPKKHVFPNYKDPVPYFAYTIIFDQFHIKSMQDWYPQICDDENIINSIIENNYITIANEFGSCTNCTDLFSKISYNYISFFELYNHRIAS